MKACLIEEVDYLKIKEAQNLPQLALFAKMPRACRADLIDIKIDGNDVSVSVVGVCPKCGTDSSYIKIKSGSVRAYQTKKTNHTGISCIQIEATTVNTVCELETCRHEYSIHV